MFDDFFNKNNSSDQTKQSVQSIGYQNPATQETKYESVSFDDFNIPKKKNWLIILMLVITVVLSFSSYMVINIVHKNKEYQREITSQASEVSMLLEGIDTKTKDIQSLTAHYTPEVIQTDDSTTVLGDTSVSLRNVRYYNDINRVDPKTVDDILGMNDKPVNRKLRAERSVYMDLASSLSQLRTQIDLIENYVNNAEYFRFLGIEINVPIQRTRDFLDKRLAQVEYITRVYDLSIEYTSWIYKVRVGVQEAFLRGLDDYSVDKLGETIYEVDTLNEKASMIDTSMLDEGPKKRHEDLVNNLTSDSGIVALIKTMYESIKNKDAKEFEKVMISLHALSTVSTNGNTDQVLSDSSIQEFEQLKSDWVKFRAELQE